MIISVFFHEKKQAQKPHYDARKYTLKKVRFFEFVWLTITKLNV